MSGSLDAFVTSSRPPLAPLATSQEIRDRASLFVAHLFRARTFDDARAAQQAAARLHRSRPTHAMYAWRAMALRPGRSGEAPDDFALADAREDDGEKWGGDRVLRVMREEGVMDAAIVVLRWYGGEMIGPARFVHIGTCAREVCRDFKITDEMEDTLDALRTLDADLAQQRATLATLADTPKPDAPADSGAPDDPDTALLGKRKRSATEPPDYADLLASKDVTKARRLVTARENAVRSVKALIQKRLDERAAEPTADAPEPVAEDKPVVAADDEPEPAAEGAPESVAEDAPEPAAEDVTETVTGHSAPTSNPTTDKNAAALANTEGEEIEVRPPTW